MTTRSPIERSTDRFMVSSELKLLVNLVSDCIMFFCNFFFDSKGSLMRLLLKGSLVLGRHLQSSRIHPRYLGQYFPEPVIDIRNAQ